MIDKESNHFHDSHSGNNSNQANASGANSNSNYTPGSMKNVQNSGDNASISGGGGGASNLDIHHVNQAYNEDTIHKVLNFCNYFDSLFFASKAKIWANFLIYNR